MLTSFFSGQADFLGLLSGTTFILLALQSHALHRLEGKTFPWRYLTLFASTHAIGEWIEILPLSYGETPVRTAVRLVLLAVSFFLLARFGQAAGRMRAARRGPGRVTWRGPGRVTWRGPGRVTWRGPGRAARRGLGLWILIPLILLTNLGALAGQGGIPATIRYFLGLPGGLWAAWALWNRRKTAGESGVERIFTVSAFCLAVFALTAGLVAPRAPFFPASSINAESFQGLFGFPVQILRAGAVLALIHVLFRHFLRLRRRLDPAVADQRWELWMMGIVASMAAIGWIGTEAIGRNTEEEMRRQILGKTRIAAAMIDREDAKRLRWSGEDLQSESYRRLKDALMLLRASSPELRFASLMGLRDGRVYVLADSEPPESPDYSPPGQWYSEVDEEYVRGLAAREEFLTGPDTDRWGTWISGEVPVAATEDGHGSISIALDIEAADWQAHIARARLTGILLSMLVAAILIFLLIVLQRQQEANARTVASLRRMHDQRSAVLRLATSKELTGGDFPGAARAIDETAARVLGVERAGIWLGNMERGWFRNVDQYSGADGVHGTEAEIAVGPVRRYFEALETGRVIDADEARADARTLELRDGYLAPRGIVSLLDAPIRLDGKLAGLVSFEHVGTARHWQDDEIRFAGEIADQAAQALLNAERTRIEGERLRLEERMRHTQKLESLGMMAGGIAHEFNNLLMGIQGNAELALADIPETSPARECLAEVQKTAQRAAELSQQMLAYAGRANFSVGPVDLGGLVAEMAQILEASISRKAAMHFSFAPDIPPVEADATSIRQVVMNLVLNASEALGEEGGRISLSTGTMECGAAYLASTWLDEGLAEGSYVWLLVEDTGCGMDAATRARLFDPFFTTKFQGRGLGLATVLGIVRAHRGAIKVESEPGRGTSVRVLLPAGTKAAAPEEAAWRGQGTILFVDDEPGIRALGRSLLERLGFTVLTAADGKECLEIYGRKADGIDCVILDLTMPVLDGAEVLRELRRIRGGVRVILSSGYGDEEIARRLAEIPPSGFIQKPYSTASLAGTLRSVLGGAP